MDSSSAKDVVSCLHDIARTGITVVAVLHQPRFEILSLCDDLLLLGKGTKTHHIILNDYIYCIILGGKTAFMGPISDALPYFRAVGYVCPPHINPADFFIDIVSFFPFSLPFFLSLYISLKTTWTSGRLPIDPTSPPEFLPPPLIVTHEVDRLRGARGPRSRSNSTSNERRGRSISGIDRNPSSQLANSSSTLLEPPRGRSISGIERGSAATLAASSSSSLSSNLTNSTSNLIDPYRGRSISGIERSPSPLESRSRSGSVHSDGSGRESPPLLGKMTGRGRSDSHEFDPSDLINQWSTRARAMSESIENTSTSGTAGVAADEALRKNILYNYSFIK